MGYTEVMNDRTIFPPGRYTRDQVHAIVWENMDIPESHKENMTTRNYPVWKNRVSDVIKKSSRITTVSDRLYDFS